MIAGVLVEATTGPPQPARRFDGLCPLFRLQHAPSQVEMIKHVLAIDIRHLHAHNICSVVEKASLDADHSWMAPNFPFTVVKVFMNFSQHCDFALQLVHVRVEANGSKFDGPLSIVHDPLTFEHAHPMNLAHQQAVH